MRQIIRKAEALTHRYAEELGIGALLGMNIDIMYERVIYPDFGIVIHEDQDLGFDLHGSKILGEFDPISNTVYIDEELHPRNGDPRRTFTLSHEVGGHAILQGDWLRSELKRLKCNRRIVTTEQLLDLETENVLERQANMFAAHMAAPTWLMNHWIERIFKINRRQFRYIGPGQYCLDVRGHSHFHTVADYTDLCRRISFYLKPFFGGLSVEALTYRIAETGWVVDHTESQFRLRRTARRSEFVGV
ncbi:MAG: hypothetical protein EXS05_20995 [Planctomycetaceae bacterium]|nr:hypothetical protein [Planctomycetaceae bacterium]